MISKHITLAFIALVSTAHAMDTDPTTSSTSASYELNTPKSEADFTVPDTTTTEPCAANGDEQSSSADQAESLHTSTDNGPSDSGSSTSDAFTDCTENSKSSDEKTSEKLTHDIKPNSTSSVIYTDHRGTRYEGTVLKRSITDDLYTIKFADDENKNVRVIGVSNSDLEYFSVTDWICPVKITRGGQVIEKCEYPKLIKNGIRRCSVHTYNTNDGVKLVPKDIEGEHVSAISGAKCVSKHPCRCGKFQLAQDRDDDDSTAADKLGVPKAGEKEACHKCDDNPHLPHVGYTMNRDKFPPMMRCIPSLSRRAGA